MIHTVTSQHLLQVKAVAVRLFNPGRMGMSISLGTMLNLRGAAATVVTRQ